MKNIIFLTLGSLFSLLLFAQGQTISVGENIDLAKFNLIATNNKKIEKNKITVLDFWATWCGPCIASFPHLDTLQKKYKGKLQILALSDEPKEKIAKFLIHKKYSISFFTDKDKSVFKLFDLQVRPLTVLISETGKLIWVGSSDDLDKVILEYLIGKPKGIESKIDAFNRKYYSKVFAEKKESDILNYQIGLNTKSENYFAKTQKGASIDSAIDIKYVAVPVIEIIQDVLSVPEMRLENLRKDLDTINIDLTVKSYMPSLTYRSMSKNIIGDLERIFNFKITEVTRTVIGYQLKIIDKKKLEDFKELIEGGGFVQSNGNKIKMTRLSLDEAANYFQKKLKLIIEYKGEQFSKYNIEVEKFLSIEDLNKQLRETYGLSLEQNVFNLEFIEIK